MSNLILIYGPPAAGKLTVAKEIEKLYGYRCFSNHTLVGSVASIFRYENMDDKSTRNRLARKFRIEIFKAAAQKKINVVTTFGGSSSDKFEFFKEIETELSKLGGLVYFVLLSPNEKAILSRVESPERKGTKIDNKEFLQEKLKKPNSYYQKHKATNSIEIDNSNLEPIKVAEKIFELFKISP